MGSSLCPVPSVSSLSEPSADEPTSLGGLLPGAGSVVAAILIVATSTNRAAEHTRARQFPPCRIAAVTHLANVFVPQMFMYKGEPHLRLLFCR